MILKLLRQGLGRVVIFIDWLTQPKMMQREPALQNRINDEVRGMYLYQLYACPFCIKTRRAIRRLNLPIETRNVHLGSPYRAQLEQGGGMFQVPCLFWQENGQDVWMYESSDIIEHLEQRFGEAAVPTNAG